MVKSGHSCRVSIVLLSICRMLFWHDPVWVMSPPVSNGECNLKGIPNERGESTTRTSPFGEVMMFICLRGWLLVHDHKVKDNWKSKKFLVSDCWPAVPDQSWTLAIWIHLSGSRGTLVPWHQHFFDSAQIMMCHIPVLAMARDNYASVFFIQNAHRLSHLGIEMWDPAVRIISFVLCSAVLNKEKEYDYVGGRSSNLPRWCYGSDLLFLLSRTLY